jgi:hypothetical protein
MKSTRGKIIMKNRKLEQNERFLHLDLFQIFIVLMWGRFIYKIVYLLS